MSQAIKTPGIYPRPFDAPRMDPEGRCCAGLANCEKIGAIAFDRGRGGFTIVNPTGIVAMNFGLRFLDRLMISFCPFCGFPWNERSAENELLTPLEGRPR